MSIKYPMEQWGIDMHSSHAMIHAIKEQPPPQTKKKKRITENNITITVTEEPSGEVVCRTHHSSSCYLLKTISHIKAALITIRSSET